MLTLLKAATLHGLDEVYSEGEGEGDWGLKLNYYLCPRATKLQNATEPGNISFLSF